MRWLRFTLAACLASGCMSSMAMSRVGHAIVTESDGVPCFSIPLNQETRHGLPLRGITVSERPTGDWRKLPDVLWHLEPHHPTALPMAALHPPACIRYGEALAGTAQGSPSPLDLYRIYHVSVRAKEDGSSMIAYGALFCVRPEGQHKRAIQMISPDEREGDRRFRVCDKP
jgi:hypothetical protein